MPHFHIYYIGKWLPQQPSHLSCLLTWVGVLESLLETGESWTKSIGKLHKDFVHGEDTLLPQVGLA